MSSSESCTSTEEIAAESGSVAKRETTSQSTDFPIAITSCSQEDDNLLIEEGYDTNVGTADAPKIVENYDAAERHRRQSLPNVLPLKWPLQFYDKWSRPVNLAEDSVAASEPSSPTASHLLTPAITPKPSISSLVSSMSGSTPEIDCSPCNCEGSHGLCKSLLSGVVPLDSFSLVEMFLTGIESPSKFKSHSVDEPDLAERYYED